MRFLHLFVIITVFCLFYSHPASAEVHADSISINRSFDILQKPQKNDYRPVLAEAASKLKSWKIFFSGTFIDGKRLQQIVKASEAQPLTRVLRENLRQPVDTYDFLLFLDDLLYHGDKQKLRGKLVWVTSGRARRAGILLHPDDVFFNKPRLYGKTMNQLSIDRPQQPKNLVPAEDGHLLGPRWTARYKNTSSEKARLRELALKNKTFARNVELLMKQLRQQGADVGLHSAYRKRERGYLMWGAFILSRARTSGEVDKHVAELNTVNKKHKLNVRIIWKDPSGWRQTIERAKKMAASYDVVYATKRGALNSDHYDARAVDISATGLPSRLVLKSPSGVTKVFNMNGVDESRDLNLSPAIIDWVEKQFNFKKLRSDYPHWSDAE
ncbi:MAG: hypothetical protein PF637_02095 [Spirochaetes bacterium]|jgi:hypothetical protein|nr:hypothetical protein [Spirochaetota bacterium]